MGIWNGAGLFTPQTCRILCPNFILVPWSSKPITSSPSIWNDSQLPEV